MYKRIILFILFAFTFVLAQDQMPGSRQITVPENIQSIKNAIRIAENNEDWQLYYQLRSQLIDAWQQVNPDIAKLYNNGNNIAADTSPDGSYSIDLDQNDNSSNKSILFENPAPAQPIKHLWGDDKMITGGMAYDISMDISRDDEIYLAVLGRLDVGSAEQDSVYIYKSTDGGETWALWSSLYSAAHTFDKIEIMCFDGQIGGSGDSYLLFFYLFDNGWLRVGRTSTSSPFWSYYTISGSSTDGYTSDFAVDRNNSATNYRAMCIYDSLHIVKSVRSDPASYGTVWQDISFVSGIATVGRDIDFCYGWNGDVYVTFNGYNSGNLYTVENINYADPASWGSLNTIVSGSTDTTRHAQIISTREDDPGNTAVVVFELRSGTTFDLYSSTKVAGGTSWGTMSTWVIPDENKWASFYSKKITGNQIFQGVFEQSGLGNAVPRIIKYKAYDGSSWSQSTQVSDDGIDVTGLQKPEAGELNGSIGVFAYVGANYTGVYFDNSNWVSSNIKDEVVPSTFSLEQNYPNPFNPDTKIKYSVPQLSQIQIKIFDILGNEIETLVNEEKPAGKYELTWNAVNFPSGVYFYQLRTGNPSTGSGQVFVQTKKMILLK